MFGRMKAGWRGLGILSDFQALWKVKTAEGVPSNIWGHKRTWVLLGAAVGMIGGIFAGDVSVFGWIQQNQEIFILIAVWAWAFFKGLRDKMKDQDNG